MRKICNFFGRILHAGFIRICDCRNFLTFFETLLASEHLFFFTAVSAFCSHKQISSMLITRGGRCYVREIKLQQMIENQEGKLLLFETDHRQRLGKGLFSKI